MSVVLFYTPFIRRSPDVESLMLEFKRRGHTVKFITQHTGEFIRPFLEAHQIEFYSNYQGESRNLRTYFNQIRYFIRFCLEHRVDVVYSHLDPANFVAAIGQYFVRSKVYLCRHHIDEAHLYNYHRSLTYRLTNFLARKIIVVSKQAKAHMIKLENVKPEKIIHINLAYDFSLFARPDSDKARTLRSELNADLVIITISRLTKHKRPELSIELIQRLRNAGMNAKLVLLGAGPMEVELRKMIVGMENYVLLPGHVFNVLEYMAAADFVVHPSILESSCVTIKEAGLVEKAVVVCSSVGDFDDYIVHGVNGFAVSRDNFVAEAFDVIIRNKDDQSLLTTMGTNLRKDIERHFDICNIFSRYEEITEGHQ